MKTSNLFFKKKTGMFVNIKPFKIVYGKRYLKQGANYMYLQFRGQTAAQYLLLIVTKTSQKLMRDNYPIKNGKRCREAIYRRANAND